MSLAELFGAKKAGEKDKGLDDIFKSSAGPSTIVTPLSATVGGSKKQATTPTTTTKNEATQRQKGKRKKGDVGEVGENEDDREKTTTSSKKKARLSDIKDESKSLKKEGKNKSEGQGEEGGSEAGPYSESESDSDFDTSAIPQHESLDPKNKERKRQKKGAKMKYVPEGETKEQRDARTIFIGNLPVKVVHSKSLTKQLKRHILQSVPSAQIESIRFRSVAFLNPTSSLPDSSKKSSSASLSSPSTKQARQANRAANWRNKNKLDDSDEEGHGGNEEEDEETREDRKGAKMYLSSAQKRKLAAIKGDVHEHSAATTNAYVVFGHHAPSNPSEGEGEVGNKGDNGDKDKMNPYEAAKEAAIKVDRTVFEGRTLRVDLVNKSRAETGASGSSNSTSTSTLTQTDPKLSIFVGNLDFVCTEDDLRAFFEKVVCEERGMPGKQKSIGGGDEVKESEDEESGDEEDKDEDESDKGKEDEEEDEDDMDEDEHDDDDEEPKKKRKLNNKPTLATILPPKPTWVTRVRIVRDRETQLGKGIGYVQFADRDCVDEILALEPEKLRFAKRTLRVNRCKAIPTHTSNNKQSRTNSQTPKSTSANTKNFRSGPRMPRTAAVEVPKGDPTLGKRLEGMDKQSRKEAKASDPTRLARRLGKKKARAALAKEEKGIKGLKGKQRVRERKDASGRKGGKDGKGVNTGKKEGGRGVRRGKNLERMNLKK